MTSKSKKHVNGLREREREPDRVTVELDFNADRVTVIVQDRADVAALEKTLRRAGGYTNPEPGVFMLDSAVFARRIGWFNPSAAV